MKKILFITLFLFFFSACKNNENPTNQGKQKTIIVTINPIKLILQEIVGDKIVIKTILPIGASPHTFEAKPSDISNLNDANLFYYVSDKLDNWATKYADNSKINKIQLISLIPQNIGIISDDPHFWTSPLIVKSLVDSLLHQIIEIDADNADFYKSNAELFSAKLDSLHSAISKQLEPIKTLPIWTEHNSFSYFINEFQLKYGGAIEESPGKERGTKYFTQLVDDIKKSRVKTIFSEPQLNQRQITAIANETNTNVSMLDPLGSSDMNYFDFINYNATQILQIGK